MTARNEKRGFAARPADPDGWIKAGDVPPEGGEDLQISISKSEGWQVFVSE